MQKMLPFHHFSVYTFIIGDQDTNVYLLINKEICILKLLLSITIIEEEMCDGGYCGS